MRALACMDVVPGEASCFDDVFSRRRRPDFAAMSDYGAFIGPAWLRPAACCRILDTFWAPAYREKSRCHCVLISAAPFFRLPQPPTRAAQTFEVHG